VAGEHVGCVSTGEARVSVALLRSSAGWVEPSQTPELDEYSAVLSNIVRLTHRGGALDVRAGQAVFARGGEPVRYSTPGADGAEYFAVCPLAFSLREAHRDGD
jgi:hypothetical protein